MFRKLKNNIFLPRTPQCMAYSQEDKEYYISKNKQHEFFEFDRVFQHTMGRSTNTPVTERFVSLACILAKTTTLTFEGGSSEISVVIKLMKNARDDEYDYQNCYADGYENKRILCLILSHKINNYDFNVRIIDQKFKQYIVCVIYRHAYILQTLHDIVHNNKLGEYKFDWKKLVLLYGEQTQYQLNFPVIYDKQTPGWNGTIDLYTWTIDVADPKAVETALKQIKTHLSQMYFELYALIHELTGKTPEFIRAPIASNALTQTRGASNATATATRGTATVAKTRGTATVAKTRGAATVAKTRGTATVAKTRGTAATVAKTRGTVTVANTQRQP